MALLEVELTLSALEKNSGCLSPWHCQTGRRKYGILVLGAFCQHLWPCQLPVLAVSCRYSFRRYQS